MQPRTTTQQRRILGRARKHVVLMRYRSSILTASIGRPVEPKAGRRLHCPRYVTSTSAGKYETLRLRRSSGSHRCFDNSVKIQGHLVHVRDFADRASFGTSRASSLRVLCHATHEMPEIPVQPTPHPPLRQFRQVGQFLGRQGRRILGRGGLAGLLLAGLLARFVWGGGFPVSGGPLPLGEAVRVGRLALGADAGEQVVGGGERLALRLGLAPALVAPRGGEPALERGLEHRLAVPLELRAARPRAGPPPDRAH